MVDCDIHTIQKGCTLEWRHCRCELLLADRLWATFCVWNGVDGNWKFVMFCREISRLKAY